MPLTEEEVLVKLKLQADASGLLKALTAFSKIANDTGKQAGAALSKGAVQGVSGPSNASGGWGSTLRKFFTGSSKAPGGGIQGVPKAGGSTGGGEVVKGTTDAATSAAGAAGGPAAAAGVGMAVQAAKAIGKAAVAGLSAPAKLVGTVMTSLTSGLKELQGPLGPIGLGFNAVAKGGQLLSKSLGMVSAVGGKALGKSFDAVIGPAKELTNTLVQMAAVASPGTFKIWTMALEDVQGVIGQTFTPILSTMTEGVRLFGDVVATILPDMSEMNAVLDEMRPDWEGLKNEIRSFAAEFGPSIREGLITVFRHLASAAGLAARGVGWLTQQLGVFLRNMGFSAAPGEQGMRSSQGAAARQASITGLEDYQRQLLTSAFSQPAGASDSPQVQTVNWLASIHGVLTTIQRAVDNFIRDAQNAGNNISRTIGTEGSRAINDFQANTGINIGGTLRDIAQSDAVRGIRAYWGW